MAIYAIGDVQGCADSLTALVSQLPFRRNRDALWFVGDLVNRGPQSARVLRMIRAAGPQAITILGNHDLHLLAVSCGARAASASDTLDDVLSAPDANDLIEFVRHRPLAHCDQGVLMVHAGVLPSWSTRQTLSLATEVSNRLQSRHWQDFMHEMYGNAPAHWRDGLRGHARLRAVVNVLTRLRYLRANGEIEFKCKTNPSAAPADLVPWFAAPNRKTARQRIVFGHWSTLGLRISPKLMGLDTGCVWGSFLTAARLDDGAIFQQVAIDGRATD
jgi:bis(5'-nucleosyl)-tetraphosphatase (symmetrical)